jgi:hypothetical protein
MIGDMTIGQLARCTGLPVRTLRVDADEGVLPEADRTESGYRLFGPEAVACGRLVRTLRELGVGLADIKRVRAPDACVAVPTVGLAWHQMPRSLCGNAGRGGHQPALTVQPSG